MTVADPPIPVVDLSPWVSGEERTVARLAAGVDHACRSVGFLIVTGHGVDPALVDEARAVTAAFFALPLEVKRRATIPTDPSRGFAAFAQTNLAASYGVEAPPDLKETFTVGPVGRHDPAYMAAGGPFFLPNAWPEEPASFREVWIAYYAAMEQLATALMRLFAVALGLPARWFDDKIDRHITYLTAQHYPPLPDPPAPGQLRAGAHSDFGSLTILQRDTAPGGLQVRVGDRWVEAPHVPGSFTINLGDLMADWTNDRWVSTVHRVVPPPGIGDARSDRLSLTFFHQPNYDAVISALPTCPPPPGAAPKAPVRSGEHFLRKLTAVRAGAGRHEA